MSLVHLDTDLGGDLDDICALAMLLRWPGVELTGVTVVGDMQGRRTGYTRYALDLAGHTGVPAAAGADVAGGYFRYELGLPAEDRYWPEPVTPLPGPIDAALDLLERSIDQGATIIAIGMYTNLYLMEMRRPGILARADLYLMGGYIYPPRPGYPQWGNDYDFNIQADVRSAKYVLEHSNPTLIPLSVTVETALRRAYLDDLRRGDALAHLIAHQAEAFAVDEQNESKHGASCPALPRDIINFQHDPLACAIALGWREGVRIETLPLRIEEQDGWLVERIHPAGKPVKVVTAIDGDRFNQFWLRTVLGGYGAG